MRRSISTNTLNIEVVLGYHERTKHQLDRYARGPGYLDWSNQPDPFRCFQGAPRIALVHGNNSKGPLYRELFGAPLAAAEINYNTISHLFYYSMALSAWKKVAGAAAWSLRVNPSSGNLHPTESYLIIGTQASPGIAAGVYHYQPYQHALEARCLQNDELWQHIAGQLPNQAFLIGLSSIYWRESWKYGERAYRYCQHDVGHAVGTITFAGACLGWKVQLVDSTTDAEISRLLCIDQQSGAEAEHAACLLAVFPNDPEHRAATVSLRLDRAVVRTMRGHHLPGNINRLSQHHQDWAIIEKVGLATKKRSKHAGVADRLSDLRPPADHLPQGKQTAFQIIHQRRSALALDGTTKMARSVFFGILERLQVEQNAVLSGCLPWPANVSLFLFVHRVRDLQPGLYVLARAAFHEPSLRSSVNPEFLWQKPVVAGFKDLRFYLLAPQDVTRQAKIISCHQDIAADGVFSVGMLARFRDVIEANGPWYYPRLYWEAGLIGQLLYLEAEAAGMRSTGIGCFFDDVMHQLLGITDFSWQSLYHFTVGAPLEDRRLQTYPCYHHLDAAPGKRS